MVFAVVAFEGEVLPSELLWFGKETASHHVLLSLLMIFSDWFDCLFLVFGRIIFLLIVISLNLKDLDLSAYQWSFFSYQNLISNNSSTRIQESFRTFPCPVLFLWPYWRYSKSFIFPCWFPLPDLRLDSQPRSKHSWNWSILLRFPSDWGRPSISLRKKVL